MKNLFKYLILPVIMLFTFALNVDAFTKICEYPYATENGMFKYRVIIRLNDETLTSSSARDNLKDKDWKNNVDVQFYNYNSEKYENDATGCILSNYFNKKRYQIGDKKICVLTADEASMDKAIARRKFFEKGLDGKGEFTCPSLYELKDTKKSLISLTVDSTKSETGQAAAEAKKDKFDISNIDINISTENMSCADLLGKNLTKIVHLIIKIIRIAGAVITVLQASIALIPPITSGDADALKKAGKKCVTLAIILAAIGLFPTLLNIIGKICGFDLSCIA